MSRRSSSWIGETVSENAGTKRAKYVAIQRLVRLIFILSLLIETNAFLTASVEQCSQPSVVMAHRVIECVTAAVDKDVVGDTSDAWQTGVFHTFVIETVLAPARRHRAGAAIEIFRRASRMLSNY